MRERRSHYDVTNSVKLSDPREVRAAVAAILKALYPACEMGPLNQAFTTFTDLFTGTLPGYHGCDTWYHDAQHSLDCTLATARLLDGYERSVPAAHRVGERRFVLAIICALFHDSGYIRRQDETSYHNGAEFTLYHVGRSGEFLEQFLPTVGFGPEAKLAAQLVHFTGYELALDRIEVRHPKDRWIGFAVATADIVAQLADRCYLEKCRSFLFHEFEACGLAGGGVPGGPKPMYNSPEELIRKTPEFTRKLFAERLDGYFEGAYKYLEKHFGGSNPYLDQVTQHQAHVARLIASGDVLALRRRPRSINARVLRSIVGTRLAAVHPHRRKPTTTRPVTPPIYEVNPAQYVPT